MATGRPRKTMAELELSGVVNQHGYRKNWNSNTPFEAQAKRAPEHYLPETKKAWNYFHKVKAVQGVLSIEDEPLVRMMFDSLNYAFKMSAAIDALYHNEEFMSNLADSDKRKQLKEMVQIYKIHESSFFSIALRFGITPTERSRLATKEQQTISPMLKLISGEDED